MIYKENIFTFLVLKTLPLRPHIICNWIIGHENINHSEIMFYDY